jgi:hypothetical protein
MENKTANYLQVGRTMACGHCEPEQYAQGLEAAQKAIPNYKCDCICHDKPDDYDRLWVLVEPFYKAGEKLNWDVQKFGMVGFGLSKDKILGPGVFRLKRGDFSKTESPVYEIDKKAARDFVEEYGYEYHSGGIMVWEIPMSEFRITWKPLVIVKETPKKPEEPQSKLF